MASEGTNADRAEAPLELYLFVLALVIPALPYLFILGKLESDGYVRKAN